MMAMFFFGIGGASIFTGLANGTAAVLAATAMLLPSADGKGAVLPRGSAPEAAVQGD